MTDKLLPCPFCGGEAVCHFDKAAGVYEITCEHCFMAGTMLEDTEANAVAAWNTRTDGKEEIVRCRDCTYYDDEPDLESSMPKCWRDPDHRGAAVWTPPDGFCAWGERRSDG